MFAVFSDWRFRAAFLLKKGMVEILTAEVGRDLDEPAVQVPEKIRW
jgi:hypothetical protein